MARLSEHPTTRTYYGHLDLACAAFADDEAELLAKIDSLERELRWANEAVQVAVEIIRARTLERDRVRELNGRLRQELKSLRDALLNDAQARHTLTDHSGRDEQGPSLPC